MAKLVSSGKRSPLHHGPPSRYRPRTADDRVQVGFRVTAAQREFVRKVGGGSLAIGFDRVLELARGSGSPRPSGA